MGHRVPDTARLFFALDPDARTRRAIQARQRALALPGRPIAGPRLHATLVFLGDQPRECIAELCALAATVDFPPHSVRLDRVGTFARAGIAWLGASCLPAALPAFREDLVRALTGAGLDIEPKPWIFHVTLYRNLRKRPRTMHVDPVDWAVSRYVLMESVPEPEGPRYRVRGGWP